MKTTTKPNDCKRGERGKGRLYIRIKGGKQLKAGSSNHGGLYWLEYNQPTGKENADGKPIKKKQRIKLLDDNGAEITTLQKAEAARDKVIRQYVLASKEELLTQVKAELENIESELAGAQDEASPPLRISNAWDDFKDHPKLDCGDTLLYNYGSHWKQFREWLGGYDAEAVYMRDIGKETAQDYARYLIRRKVSPSTYNKHINFLKLIFDVLSDEIRAEVFPFAGIATKKLAKTKAKASARQRKRRELSLEELIKAIDEAEGDLQTLLMLGAYTGLRLGDCCTLKWNECSLERGLVKRVPNKTQGEPIQIGIPPRLVQRLSEIPKAKRKGYVLPKYAEDYNYVSESGKNSHRTRITNRIQKHFMDCGINTHAEETGFRLEPDPDKEGKFRKIATGKRAVVEVGFHSLRHTFVSMQAERGIPQSVVQKIVGHGSPAMTAHYTHVSEKAAKDATLFIGDGVQDAEFEDVPEAIPKWIREKLGTVNAKNWKQIINEILEGE